MHLVDQLNQRAQLTNPFLPQHFLLETDDGVAQSCRTTHNRPQWVFFVECFQGGFSLSPSSPICSWQSLHPIRSVTTQIQIGIIKCERKTNRNTKFVLQRFDPSIRIIKCEQGKKIHTNKNLRLNASRRGPVPPASESPDPTIVITSHHPPPRSPMGHTHTADPRPPPPDKYAFASTAGQDQGGGGG